MRDNELSQIVNNLANINTTGYKRLSFSSRVYHLLAGRPYEVNAVYHDARVQTYFGTQYIDTSQGSLKQTKNPFDIAIEGEGFFAVRHGNRVLYTREGSFTKDKESLLVTQTGLRVLDENNNPILIEGTNIEIGKDGSILVDRSSVGRIKLVRLNNLRHIGHSLYEGTETGRATGKTLQGWIEGSNVNPISEMVQMIQAIRSFDITQRITSNFDQLAQKAVSEIARV